MIKVVNKYKKNKIDPKEIKINIMRGTVFGNPFVIGKDGTREDVLEKFKKETYRKFKLRGEFYEEIVKLCSLHKNKKRIVLECCCKPKLCHGDVLKYMIEEYTKLKF